MWSLDKLLVAALAMLKIALIGTVIAWCVYGQRDAIVQLAGLDAPQIARFLCELVLWTALKTGGCLLALGLVDYGFQWWRHEQSLKLSETELRDEQRDLQASPEIVSRRRALQRDLTSRRADGAIASDEPDEPQQQPTTMFVAETTAPASRR